jgi:hypothetical protein
MAAARRRPRGPRPLRDAINAFWRDSGLSNSGVNQRVFRAWTEVIEPDRRRQAVPVRFRDGELLVEIESAVHLQELKNFKGDGLRLRANERLGKDVIQRVVFKLKGSA